jgi:hypothetical protein
MVVFGSLWSTLAQDAEVTFSRSFTEGFTFYEVDDYTGRELQMLRDIRSGGGTPITNYFGPLKSLRYLGVKVGASIFYKNDWINFDEYQEAI